MAAQVILVIDDEQNIREVARMYLKQDGYRVAVARDGPKPCARFRQCGQR